MKKYCIRAMLFALILTLTLSVLVPAVSAAEVVEEPEKSPFNAQTLAFYRAIRAELEKIADGTRSDAHLVFDEEALKGMGLRTEWTAADFGVESIGENEKSQITAQFLAQLEGYEHLLDALIHDMPGELYWFDKTGGFLRELRSLSWGVPPTVDKVNISEFHCYFMVSPDYWGEGYSQKNPVVDPASVSRAQNAIAAADALVERYAELSDYQKLLAYRNEICSLVSYNNGALSSDYTGGYGDPWQMIYVFDGDPSTNVVCEGYAKAFAYLCSQSSFAADVKCYTVSGEMRGGTGDGGHMWNILSIDGVSYLVDVTNSDEGTVGENGELFLAGYDRTEEEAYVFSAGNTEISYIYSDDMLAVFENYGILLLNESDYTPPTFEIVLSKEGFAYTGNALTVGDINSGADIIYRAEVLPQGNYRWEVEWYQDGERLSAPPMLPGTYLLKITAHHLSNVLYRFSEERTVTIERAIPQYSVPEALHATYGDLISSVTLPTGFSWRLSEQTDEMTVGNAGPNAHVAVFTPEDTALYRSVDVTLTVQVSPKDIASAEIVLDAFPHYTGGECTLGIRSVTLDGLHITYRAEGNRAIEVGNYTLTLTGTGNYCGTVTREWSILPSQNAGVGDASGDQTGDPDHGTDQTPDGDTGANGGASDKMQNGDTSDGGDQDQTVLIIAIGAAVGIPLLCAIIFATGKKKR